MDHYYKIGSSKIHWAQLFASLACVALLAFVVCFMLSHGLNTDFKGLKAEALKRAKRRRGRLVDNPQQMNIEASRASNSTVPWKKLYGQVYR